MMERIDAFRVVQDPTYAASLTDAEWRALALDPAWSELVGEFHELVAPILARYGENLGVPAPQTPSVSSQTPAAAGALQVVGTRVPRMHGLGVVTNRGQYVHNMRVPGMLHARTLRSPHPHANVTRVDTTKAEALAGVVAVLHAGNLPAEYRDVKFGSGPPDRFLFNTEVFEVGAPIAVVAAENEHIADQALHLIDVEYETLPATLDMMEGTRPNALKQWNNKENGTIVAVTPPLVRGNPDGARADTTIEAVLTKPVEQHVALEPTSSLLYWDRERLIVYYTSQHAHGSRAGLSQALKIPPTHPGHPDGLHGIRLRIAQQRRHGGGARGDSRQTDGRPIKTICTREEDFVMRTHRPAFRNEMKLGVNRTARCPSGTFASTPTSARNARARRTARGSRCRTSTRSRTCGWKRSTSSPTASGLERCAA